MRHMTILEARADNLDRARLGLRVAVCKRCAGRPPGSELLGADHPRACEKQCELFIQLGTLLHVAHCVDPMVGSFERTMGEHLRHVSDRCAAKEMADGTPHGLPPWAHHTQRIIPVLRNVVGI